MEHYENNLKKIRLERGLFTEGCCLPFGAALPG